MSESLQLAARMIVARTAGVISTHWEDCHLYHLPCFAVFVLDQGGVMKTFQYDAKKIPQPEMLGDYIKLGSWSFDPNNDECDLAYAQDAIYAWIAWYEFVANRKETL